MVKIERQAVTLVNLLVAGATAAIEGGQDARERIREDARLFGLVLSEPIKAAIVQEAATRLSMPIKPAMTQLAGTASAPPDDSRGMRWFRGEVPNGGK